MRNGSNKNTSTSLTSVHVQENAKVGVTIIQVNGNAIYKKNIEEKTLWEK